MSIQVIPIKSLKDNYIWIVRDHADVVIIDPGTDEGVIDFIKKTSTNPKAILVTHHHYDHVNGIQGIKKTFPDLPVYGTDSETFQGKTCALIGSETIHITAQLQFQVMSIPGHTSGHVGYLLNKDKQQHFFAGDTIFAAGCGRIFDGKIEQLHSSLKKINAYLDEDALIYCGHEYTLNNLSFARLVEPNNIEIKNRLQEATIQRNNKKPTIPFSLRVEQRTNPFLRCDQLEIKEKAEQFLNKELYSELEIFIALRQWKNIL